MTPSHFGSTGDRIHWLRRRLDLTQTDIARELGRYTNNEGSPTPSHVSLIEKDKRNMSQEIIIGMAHILDTSTDFLLGLTDDYTPRTNGKMESAGLTEEAKRAAEIVDALPVHKRRLLLGALEMFVVPAAPEDV